MKKKADDAPKQTIYVRKVMDDGDESYLIASETLDGFEDGDIVGAYRLIALHPMVVRTERYLEHAL